MTSLILTTNDSSAGCLKAAQIADHVVAIAYRLATGPVPPISDPVTFFAERAKLSCPETRRWEEDEFNSNLGHDWLELTGIFKNFDSVEIWPDPDPNSQLELLQLLDWLRCDSDVVKKLALVNFDSGIGSHTPEEIPLLRPSSQQLSAVHFETANLALRAFQQPTPEEWFNLLREDLEVLPYLRRTVIGLLEELPAVGTALTTSETKLLDIISRCPTGPLRVFGEYIANNPLSVLNYWELGQALHQLAHCKVPAILGLNDGRFTLELHDDKIRYERYKRNKLSLSELGQALLEQQEDFSRHNRIERWWGGTKLTNDRLWRWDAANNILVSPN